MWHSEGFRDSLLFTLVDSHLLAWASSQLFHSSSISFLFHPFFSELILVLQHLSHPLEARSIFFQDRQQVTSSLKKKKPFQCRCLFFTLSLNEGHRDLLYSCDVICLITKNIVKHQSCTKAITKLFLEVYLVLIISGGNFPTNTRLLILKSRACKSL